MRRPINHNNNSARWLVSVLVLGLGLTVSAPAGAVIETANSMSSDPKPSNVDRDPSSSRHIEIKPANVDTGVSPPPPVLKDLQQVTNGDSGTPETLGLQIRADAMREGALSYGARGGLAFRTFEIQRRLAEYDTSMSKTYDFGRLLIPAPSGFLIEPPVVSEAQKAVLVKTGGQAAAVADRIYHINRNARIVTAARNWRLYLERDWGRVDSPPDILLPKDDNEREAWSAYVAQGWDEGVKQAEETFEADIDRMTADFVGMVRYRDLLAQNMISPPFALADDRGITGGGSDMRIGDRGVTITAPSQLMPQGGTWTPAQRQ
jgi:defect-in-organelle-trafficking protein DotC